jgi:hypothetical protein
VSGEGAFSSLRRMLDDVRFLAGLYVMDDEDDEDDVVVVVGEEEER